MPDDGRDELVLSDEVERRDRQSSALRARNANIEFGVSGRVPHECGAGNGAELADWRHTVGLDWVCPELGI